MAGWGMCMIGLAAVLGWRATGATRPSCRWSPRLSMRFAIITGLAAALLMAGLPIGGEDPIRWATGSALAMLALAGAVFAGIDLLLFGFTCCQGRETCLKLDPEQ